MTPFHWSAVWRRNITSVPLVAQICQISERDRASLDMKPLFPVSIPRRFVDKMEKGNVNDPLFRQCVPTLQERTVSPNFTDDPLCESSACLCGRILQKYQARALLVTTKACGMHCRFCFRRHFHYAEEESSFGQELFWLKEHAEIDEVVLSGGDPLALPERALESLLNEISHIPHIARVRLHTRFPIGIPERIDERLLACFQHVRPKIVMVFHVNHPNELDSDVLSAFRQLSSLGIPLLTQTVLLRGVNDSAEVLVALMKALGNAGVLPYYLHQLDRVQGAAHFEVPLSAGLRLADLLHSLLPGYLVPKFVQEIPGKSGKTVLSTSSRELGCQEAPAPVEGSAP